MYIYTNNGNNSVPGWKFRVCGCDIQKNDPINRHKKKEKRYRHERRSVSLLPELRSLGENWFTMNNTRRIKIPVDGEEREKNKELKKKTHEICFFDVWADEIKRKKQKFSLANQGL